MASLHAVEEAVAPERPHAVPAGSRSLPEIVVQEYDGNLMAFCRRFGFSDGMRSRLSALLSRDRSVEISGAIIAKVSAALRSDAATLFPESVLLHRRYTKLRDTPGYQAIAAKHQLRFRGHLKPTLASLMRDKGFSSTDIQRLRNLLQMNFALPSNKKFCERLSRELEIPLEELFPVEMYGRIDREAWDGGA